MFWNNATRVNAICVQNSEIFGIKARVTYNLVTTVL